MTSPPNTGDAVPGVPGAFYINHGYIDHDDQPTRDESDPDAWADRGARLRAELDALDTAKLNARIEALGAAARAAEAHGAAGRALDDAVAEARGWGATWQQIADAVGLTRSAAWERWANRG